MAEGMLARVGPGHRGSRQERRIREVGDGGEDQEMWERDAAS